MFTAADILEEFVSVASLADRITPEACQWRFTLRVREQLRLAQAAWRSRPGNLQKKLDYMVGYYQRTGTKEANRARMKARWADPVRRRAVQEYQRKWRAKRAQCP